MLNIDSYDEWNIKNIKIGKKKINESLYKDINERTIKLIEKVITKKNSYELTIELIEKELRKK